MEIGAAVTAVREALRLARTAKDVNDRAELNAAMSDIMEKLTSAQSDLLDLLTEHHQLIDENRELKHRLNKEERFDDYELCETPLGGRYILKLRQECITQDRPSHAICPQCKEDGKLIIMTKNETHYSCSKCRFSAFHTRRHQ